MHEELLALGKEPLETFNEGKRPMRMDSGGGHAALRLVATSSTSGGAAGV